VNKPELPIYAFGAFRLDAGNRTLRRGVETVHVTEKVFNILLLLLERRGRLVTKEELIEEVWRDSIVEDNNLTVSMSALRKALGENHAGPHYIETIPKRGYRFVAQVRTVPDNNSVPSAIAIDDDRLTEPRPSGGDATTALAVLPLLNESQDPNLEYLSDGITESIINSLSALPQLKVLARSTMFRFKHSELDPIEVGRQLSADALLTGRILLINNALVIKLELIGISDGTQLWGEQYQRKPADIFEVQAEIAREVSDKLQLRLTGKQKKQLAKRYTENTDAYHLYLKGRYFWSKRTSEALTTGIEFFRKAIAIDPGYALAYAGLADSYAIIAFYANLPPKPAFEEAQKANAKALELDDSLAEAHASLAFIKEYYEWDWAGAGREYLRAIELSPNYATAHQWYGMYFMKLGQIEDARRELERALRLDPYSLIINSDLGLPYYFNGQYPKAIKQFRSVLKVDRDFIWARFFLGWAYEAYGKFANAIEEFQTAQLIDDRPEVTAMIGHAYAVSGRRNQAISILTRLEEQSKRHYISPYYIALIFVGLEDHERAFEWLEKAYSDRNEWLVWLKVDPRFDRLRSDHRFASLLRRIGHTN
jgi:DNA-binding winged helix-turn-helix (wHTH) protein/Tfp pilus assembly protein PilF